MPIEDRDNLAPARPYRLGKEMNMIVIASANGDIGMQDAMQVLKNGGSAMDAVEAGIRVVETNPEDRTVGLGGYPNLLGEMEVDAAIMDGRDLTTGAVGAVRDCLHPISLARKVMETLPHVFLVGLGAERFAAEMGFEPVDLLTEETRQSWVKRLRADHPEADLNQLDQQPDLWKWVMMATDPERAKGTINFIVRDGQGDIAAGVSTSGWAWKYPGRLGDSPIVGAGLYADNRFGAAACTGMGEMAIRACTAHSAVFYLKMGLSLDEAGRRAMLDLNDLGGRYLSQMNFLVMDKDGKFAGFSNVKDWPFAYMTAEMEEPVIAPRIFVKTEMRWGRDPSP